MKVYNNLVWVEYTIIYFIKDLKEIYIFISLKKLEIYKGFLIYYNKYNNYFSKISELL